MEDVAGDSTRGSISGKKEERGRGREREKRGREMERRERHVRERERNRL